MIKTRSTMNSTNFGFSSTLTEDPSLIVNNYNSTENSLENLKEEHTFYRTQKTHQSKHKHKNKHKHKHKPHRKTVTYHELPQWQKDNDFIINGYVRETNCLWHCFDTMFFFNNETLNIFTHLLPGTVLPVLLVFLIPYLISHSNFIKFIPPWLVHLPAFTTTDDTDYLIFMVFFIGFMVCLSCSATFHMLKVHSHKVASMGSRLDYAGILLLIASSLIGIIYYAFIDHPILRNTFISITSITGLIALLITWHPDFRTAKWRPIRTSTFVIFAFTGLIPICTSFFLYNVEVAVNRFGLKYIGYEALSYLSGAALYAFRMPERLSPGSFDLVGNSHQIFHCLVVLGAYWHFRALVHSYIVAKSITLGGHLVQNL